MRDWRSLTPEERKAERDKVPGHFNRKTAMDQCLSITLAILRNEPDVQKEAWKLAWGDYLINSPVEIAAHCRAAAHGKD